MAKDDAAFSTANTEDGRFFDRYERLDSHSESMQMVQAPQGSERPKEDYEDKDNTSRTALMDCYNG
jgi:hypothetical protein